MNVRTMVGYGMMVAISVAYLEYSFGIDVMGQQTTYQVASLEMVKPGLPGRGRRP